MDVDNNVAAPGEADPLPGLNRRSFVRNSGRALYLAPTLTLLGAAAASAGLGSPPPPPPGGAAPAAPDPTL